MPALVFLLLVACQSPIDDAPGETSDSADTTQTTDTTDDTVAPPLGDAVTGSSTIQTTDGADHTWHDRVPSTPAPAAGRAALIWLHGDGGTGEGYALGFAPYTDADGAVLITPTGANRTWTHAASDLPGMPQDSQFLSKLIDELIATGVAGEAIDPARIYLGGSSRGAYMPYFLLQRASTRDRFAAVAVNAGLLYCQVGDLECKVDRYDPVLHSADTPILHIHGTNDGAVSPAPTAAFHDPVDWDVDWRVFSRQNLWALQHGCFGGDNSTGKDDGVEVERFQVNGRDAVTYDLSGWGPACAQYQLTLVTDGGHVIANMEGRIWGFFTAHGG